MYTAIINGDDKLIYDLFSQFVQLYDLKEDPGEKTNLFASQPAAYARLSRLLDAYMAFRACKRRYHLTER
ncbi:MAG: hypothetical protein AUK47_08115 [Deltaproteobacteria bacterium CG2_30_63_29]|nr:MAG: hypothetical protein AUK47_08115 [Deltaproteobacteria bacterium CG2_30_63_29]PJB43330.1 MAG: hypothetical protein CO108_10185 [Deltaproteobacteria bacterium CG_4_9_14_3_um_filter_63_12]